MNHGQLVARYGLSAVHHQRDTVAEPVGAQIEEEADASPEEHPLGTAQVVADRDEQPDEAAHEQRCLRVVTPHDTGNVTHAAAQASEPAVRPGGGLVDPLQRTRCAPLHLTRTPLPPGATEGPDR